MKVQNLSEKLTFGVLALFAAGVSSARAELSTVAYVDVSKYLGDWYQIAHVPLQFEFGNCSCALQKLRLSAKYPGAVDVSNSCNSGGPSGTLRTIHGEAYNDDPATNSKFTVDFHLPFKGSYWIIGLDSEYRFAVVSDKNESSLYILSKTPVLEGALYQQAIELAARQMDTSKLVLTDQKNCTYPALQ